MMYKKNYKEAVERNKLFLKRKLMDGILFTAGDIKDNPYLLKEKRDVTWKDRECLAVSDKKWVIENCRRQAMVYQDIEDDTINSRISGYPTLHFGESIYSAMLNGEVKFVGTARHTCSGAKPLIRDENDLYKLKIDESNYWVKVFKESASFFAEKARGEFPLTYFITIDALNLAVELLGATETYLMLYDNEELLRKIMDFGVEYNIWFYQLQKAIYAENNRKAFEDEELYEIYDKTWHSIDAYDACNPDTYDIMGFEYQQRLISAVGGGELHTHGTGIFKLLPKVAKLTDVGIIQVGRDTKQADVQIGVEYFPWFREVTGDIPLKIYLSKEEFIEGINKQALPTGVVYACSGVDNIEQANRLAYMAKEYRLPRQI